MNNEYIIINRTALEKRIKELECLKKLHCYNGEQPNEHQFHRHNTEQLAIKQILSQSIPLIPEIEKAFDEGLMIDWGKTQD